MHVFSLQYCQNLRLQSLDAHTQASDLQRYNYKKAKSKFQGTYFLFLSGSQGFPALSRGAKRCGWRAIKALRLTLFYVLKEV